MERQQSRARVRVRASSTSEEASGGAVGSSSDASAVSIIKTRMLQLSTEYGDPAINVPNNVQRALNDLAKQLEEEKGVSEPGRSAQCWWYAVSERIGISAS